MATAKKKKTKWYPGCLAHAVIGMCCNVVANQREPQYTFSLMFYSVGANRGQLLYIYILRTGGGACTRYSCLAGRSRTTIVV